MAKEIEKSSSVFADKSQLDNWLLNFVCD